MTSFSDAVNRDLGGLEFTIRCLVPDDAEALLDYVRKVSRESDTLASSPARFDAMTVDEERAFLSRQQASGLPFLVGMIDGEFVAACSVHPVYSGERCAHRVSMGITVKKRFWGKGLGRAILEELIVRCRDNQVRKVELEVRSDHEGAIALYRKVGFQDEGTRSRGMCIDDVFYDVLQMGLEIDLE